MAFVDPLYPVALVLSRRRCLVVGGGRVAARKISGLLRCGAVVTVVAPDTCRDVDELDVAIEHRPYQAGEAANYYLVVSATGVAAVDAQVARDCEDVRVLVNSADDPVNCNFILPAVLRRGPVTIAVSTGGEAPAFAGALRDDIAAVVGPSTERLAAIIAATRRGLKDSGQSTEGLDWAALIESVRPLVDIDPVGAQAVASRWAADIERTSTGRRG